MAKDFDLGTLKYRVEDILEGITDGTLLVLKGHLLLEEVLYDRVCAKCPNPEFIEKAGLNFYRLLNIARALHPLPTDDAKRKQMTLMLWDAMAALGTLRNRLAHHLEPKDLGPLLKQLQVGPIKGKPSLSDPDVVNGLGISISFLLGTAAALGSENRRRTKRENEILARFEAIKAAQPSQTKGASGGK